jgi:ABC-type oligopeptide transport system substrate-binding subunit
MANSKLEFFRASWIADYPDAQNYLSLLYSKNHSPNGPNYTHYGSPAFDVLYERANRITDQDERFTLYQKMDSMVLEDAPMVLLFYDKVMRFYDRKWIGLEPDALNTLDLKRVYSSEKRTTTP